jgi:hypothetical protein
MLSPLLTTCRIDIDDLMTHMRAIFSSHEDLFDLFCRFLPEQEQTCCPSALDFVSYVKARSDSAVYTAFLALLNTVERGEIDVPEVRHPYSLFGLVGRTNTLPPDVYQDLRIIPARFGTTFRV